GRDAAMRWVVGGRAVTDQGASTSQMGRFETRAMTSPTNLTALADLSGRWIDRVQRQRARTALVLDIDSSVSPTYGAQEGTAYNGHFACTCYHPLFVFNQDGDRERCALVGFIVTNLHRPAKKVVAFYNGRGTAEQWIKEGKNAVKWTRLSCTTFRANAVRLQLHALAYNLANFLRTLALPGEVERWSLTTLREKVVKIGAKVVAHGRLPRVPDGRGRGAPRAVRPHPRPDREAAPAGPGSMLTLDGRAGGEPGVEMRPECVHGVPKSSRKSLGEVPEAHGGRQEGALPRQEQKTLAFEATRAVSKLPRRGRAPVHLGNVR